MEKHLFYNAQQSAIEKQRKEEGITPLSSDFQENTEEKPMDYRDYFMSVKSNIQEKIAPSEEDLSPDQIKKIHELISPELMLDYKIILLDFKKKAVKNNEHTERELIDVSDKEVQQKIDNWIKQLEQEILSKNSELTREDFAELENLSNMFFQSMASTFNTRSIEFDIKDLFKEKDYHSLHVSLKKDAQSDVSKQISEKYKLTAAEAKILVELQINQEEEFNPKILLKTLTEIFKQYDINEKKAAIGKISAGFLCSRLFQSWAPERLSKLTLGTSPSDLIMSGSILSQFFFMEKLGELISTRTEQELNVYMNELSKSINERITGSLFFQEFEFMHEKQSGELFTALENGKRSTLRLIDSFIVDFAPTGFTLASSLAFLCKINPILGGAGLITLPVTYCIAQKKQKELSHLYRNAREKQSKIYSHINSVKTGFEEVRISPDIDSVAFETKDMMNLEDDLGLERENKELTARQMFEIPRDISVLATTMLSLWLQQKGEIPPGAVISGVMYNHMLQYPLKNMITKYFNQYSYNVDDIRQMNKIFGAYEKFDVPEGEKENSRIPTSQLTNLDISFKDIGFKNIFKNLNMELKQGEFVTIGGSSGAGKTTLLRNIVGLYRPDKGSIEIGGFDIKNIKRYGSESIYSIMTYCNQSPIIFESMTLKENLMLWTKKDHPDEKIVEVLQKLNLGKFAAKLDQRTPFLSGGEKVRFGVARMLLKDPKIILLDEPTASLDPEGAIEVRKIIQEIHQNNPEITIICVSHDKKLLEIGDRMINLK